MGTQLNEEAYKKLVAENIAAMEKHMPLHSLEKKHIIKVLEWSIDRIYHKDCAINIVCAAVWYKNGKKYPHMPRNVKSGIVTLGWGHANCMAIMGVIFPNREYVLNNKDGETTIQGFLTSQNNYVDREEAGKIAFKAGQTKELIKKLYSEDLRMY